MTEAHHLTPEDAATLRRRLPRVRMGTTTAAVTLAVSAYAYATATGGWSAVGRCFGGLSAASGYLAMGVGLAALLLAYPAPRTGAACGTAWTTYLGYCSFVPHGDVVIAPGGVSATVAFAGASVLAVASFVGAQPTARRRALLLRLQSVPLVPPIDPATRAGMMQTRAMRTALGAVALAVAGGFAFLAVDDVERTNTDLARVRTAMATVTLVDDQRVPHVLIDGHEYALDGSDAVVGDTIEVRYDPESGYAEDATAPYDPGGPAFVTGLAAPFAGWLLGVEVARRRSIRRLLTSGGAALWAQAARASGGLSLAAARDEGPSIGIWRRVAGDPTDRPRRVTSDVEGTQFVPALVVAAEPNLDAVAVLDPDDDTWETWIRTRDVAGPTPGAPADASAANTRARQSLERRRRRALQTAERTLAQTAAMRRTGDSLSWSVPGAMLLVGALATWGHLEHRLFLVVPALYVAYHWSWLGSPSLAIREHGLAIHGRLLVRTYPWSQVAGVEAWRNAVVLQIRTGAPLSGSGTAPVIVPAGPNLPPLLAGDPDPAEVAGLVEGARAGSPTVRGGVQLGPTRPVVMVAVTIACTVAGALIGLTLR